MSSPVCLTSVGECESVKLLSEMEIDSLDQAIPKERNSARNWAEETEGGELESSREQENRKNAYPYPPDTAADSTAVSRHHSYASVVTGNVTLRRNTTENYYLPPNHDWSHYVLLNCTTKVRPIFTTDILEALARQFDVRQIISIGAFGSANVFLVELYTSQAKQQVLSLKNVKVAGADVAITTTQENQVTLTLINIPHAITQSEVGQALSPWCSIISQQHLYCPDPRFSHIIINRRKITVKVHSNTNIDDIPQVLVIASFRVPCFVAGRPPRCYGCGKVGHFNQSCPKIANETRIENLRITRPTTVAVATSIENSHQVQGEPQDVEPARTRLAEPEPVAVDAQNVKASLIHQDDIQGERQGIHKNESSSDDDDGGHSISSTHVLTDEGHVVRITSQPYIGKQSKRRSDETENVPEDSNEAQQERSGVSNEPHDPEAVDDGHIPLPVKKKPKKQKKKTNKLSSQVDAARSPIQLRNTQTVEDCRIGRERFILSDSMVDSISGECEQVGRKVGFVCYICGKVGHISRDCPEGDKDERKCSDCGGTSHINSDCPEPGTSASDTDDTVCYRYR